MLDARAANWLGDRWYSSWQALEAETGSLKVPFTKLEVTIS